MAVENFTKSKEELKNLDIDWVKKQTQDALKNLGKEVDDNNPFYEKKMEGEKELYEYKMDIVRDYLQGLLTKVDGKSTKEAWVMLQEENTSAWITAVQIALASLENNKYGISQIDGIMGANTRGAVSKFQSENGLLGKNGAPDGLPGKDTIGKLLEKLGGSVVTGGGSQDAGGEVVKQNQEPEEIEKDGVKYEVVSVESVDEIPEGDELEANKAYRVNGCIFYGDGTAVDADGNECDGSVLREQLKNVESDGNGEQEEEPSHNKEPFPEKEYKVICEQVDDVLSSLGMSCRFSSNPEFTVSKSANGLTAVENFNFHDFVEDDGNILIEKLKSTVQTKIENKSNLLLDERQEGIAAASFARLIRGKKYTLQDLGLQDKNNNSKYGALLSEFRGKKIEIENDNSTAYNSISKNFDIEFDKKNRNNKDWCKWSISREELKDEKGEYSENVFKQKLSKRIQNIVESGEYNN